MDEVTWGLDLSTDPHKCAAVAIRWHPDRAEIVAVRTPLRPGEIVDLIASETGPFAVDVPFGWPDTFVQFLAEHQQGAQQPPGDRDAWRISTLARRLTDERLRHIALPLPASFDRLGRTAVMWSAIEHDLRAQGVVIDRSGTTGRVCETYPKALQVSWGLGKVKLSLDLLRAAFPFLEVPEAMAGRLATDDARDAVVCSLAARARELGLTDLPAAEELDQARREGWIHITSVSPSGLLRSAPSGRPAMSGPTPRSISGA
ncbi:DUF429 domain-containing protein [Ornithinimicrobium cavernae]|uniref:DUF429 domain-containing protein n=1 Tax=Ornithinimicrobium cavernae TaxID=2666047 RepID=UPI000D69B15E|nr:DUF429 domain-containing protein [Ornithinimicrobium cavernae]